MARGQLFRIPAFTPVAQDLATAVEAFLDYCRAKNLSANTIVYYRYRLDALKRYLEGAAPGTTPGEITPPVVRGFIAEETRHNSASTANHSVITLRAFFNYLVQDGFLEASPMSRVERVRQPRPIIQTFTLEQIQAIIGSCRKDFVGVRDRAIVLLLLDCGLRATELCDLRLHDISWSEQTMLVRGKGEKERLVPFGQAAKTALTQYLARRGDLETDAFFVSC